jgi:hypothetical protein
MIKEHDIRDTAVVVASGLFRTFHLEIFNGIHVMIPL